MNGGAPAPLRRPGAPSAQAPFTLSSAARPPFTLSSVARPPFVLSSVEG